MTKTFTQTDLIRFIYHETSEKETLDISQTLICDSELQEQYKELIAMKSFLDHAWLEPSADTVDNILKVARSK